MVGLTDSEIEVLRICNGEDVPGWQKGAAMNACAEFLQGSGYVDHRYEITKKGKALLARLEVFEK